MLSTVKASLVALALSLGLAAPVLADEWDDAIAAYDRSDYATALRMFRSLAEQGDDGAQQNLGLMYEEGRAGPKDYSEAAKWYRRAADSGLPMAQNNLGTMYEKGTGVLQDFVEAHKWYNLATMNSTASEEKLRSMAARNRESLAAIITPAQIAEAQKLAGEWKPK